jgi:hypothetical protein
MAEIAVVIDREPGAPTVGAFAADPNIGVNVIRDASVSDRELLEAFRSAFDFYIEVLLEEGLPVPEPPYEVAVVAA